MFKCTVERAFGWACGYGHVGMDTWGSARGYGRVGMGIGIDVCASMGVAVGMGAVRRIGMPGGEYLSRVQP